MTQIKKAKRKLSDIDFSAEGAHVAITHRQQGYSANGHPQALILKAHSPEFIQKVQAIQVTLSLPDFLRKFYNLYWDDAETLARLLGYVPPEMEEDESYNWREEEEKYIAEKLQAYTVIKSLKDSTNLAKSIAELKESDLLQILESQAKLEPLLKAKEDTSQIGTEVNEDEVSTSVVNKLKKGKSGMIEKTKQEQKVEVDMIEKSAFVALQKSLEEQKVALEKATETIAVFQAEKKEAIAKAKTSALEAVVDAKHLEVIKKVALTIEDDKDFNDLVSALGAMKEAVEKSKGSLFEEQGVSGEGQEQINDDSPVAKLIKAKYQVK